jgi:hypothetical protein
MQLGRVSLLHPSTAPQFPLLIPSSSSQGYSARALSPAQSAILDDLEAYGLIYRRHDHSRHAADGDRRQRHDEFFPTGLATTLCSGGSPVAAAVGAGEGMGSQEGDKGFLILETNYKVYAYTCTFFLCLNKPLRGEV